MRYWINLVMFFLFTSYLICSQATGQQSNPFDVIITKHTVTPVSSENPISTNQEDRSYDNESRQDSSSLDTTLIDSHTIAIDSPQVISEGNPFNIKKTSNQIKERTPSNTGSTSIADSQIEKGVALTPPTPKSNSNWFSKLKPKQSADSSIDYSLNFIFWLLIVSLLILAVIINLKRKSFLNLYRAITNDNYLKLLQREEYNGSSFFFLLLYFLFFLNAALFLYQVLIKKFEIQGYKVFLFLFLALLIIYTIRLISIFILRITFPLEKEAKQYNFTIMMFNVIVGLLLIPVNILTAYAPFGDNMIYVGVGIIAFFYVLRQIRGLFIAARIKGLSYFHFFIYLCTFEVAPIFWIISFVKNWYSVS